jgi:hypothetical protein
MIHAALKMGIHKFDVSCDHVDLQTISYDFFYLTLEKYIQMKTV